MGRNIGRALAVRSISILPIPPFEVKRSACDCPGFLMTFTKPYFFAQTKVEVHGRASLLERGWKGDEVWKYLLSLHDFVLSTNFVGKAAHGDFEKMQKSKKVPEVSAVDLAKWSARFWSDIVMECSDTTSKLVRRDVDKLSEEEVKGLFGKVISLYVWKGEKNGGGANISAFLRRAK